MAQLDESEQSRENFAGNAAGWSERETQTQPASQAPAPGAPETSPPPPDAPAAPSAEEVIAPAPQEPASEQAPPPPSQPEPEKWNEPPKERWDARQRELEGLRQQNQQLTDIAQRTVAQPQPVATPVKDPWEGKVNNPDPAIAQQWQEVRTLMIHERQQAKNDAVQELLPTIQAGMEKLAQQDLRTFRKDNPDIKPGSEDENAIVAYMNGQVDGVRHPLESARRNVMHDRLETENRALKSKHATIPQKRAANTEPTSGIPATAGLPPKPGDWRDVAGKVLDEGGNSVDAANAVFGGSKR